MIGSAEYQTGINSAIRKLYSKVVINYTDAFLDPTITGSSTSNNYISYPQQMVNGRTVMTHKWSELDGQMILDGSFRICAPAACAALTTASTDALSC